jgi:hypothetical protein
MKTPWGERLTADDAWPDYPRPLLVRDAWHNLNGLWQYAITPANAPRPDRWDGHILVPFCVESALSGVARGLESDQRLWYRRTFTTANLERRTLLHFGGVDYHAILWVNGAPVGAHSGGFDAFSFDITPYVRDGENEIVLAVSDPGSDGEQPRGKQHRRPNGIWYTPVSGIWQTVWVEHVPRANHIAEVRAYPELQRGCVDIEVLLARPTRSHTLAVAITVTLEGRTVARTVARPDRRVHLSLDEVRAWSPDDPALYDIEVELVTVEDPLPLIRTGESAPRVLRSAEEARAFASARRTEDPALDRVRSYFGLRSIRIGPHPRTGLPTLLLNERAQFHLATLDQGWWPDGLLTPPSDAAMRFELQFLKDSGFTAVRKHIKVEPARWYSHCDRLGLLVWQDMPSGFLPAQFVDPSDEAEALRTSAATIAYEHELSSMVRALRGHPSVVMWVLHNEGWGQFDTARLTALIRSIDPTRPVDATSGWRDVGEGDVIDVHDYTPEPKAPQSDGRRALVIGEYGGIGWPHEGHLWNPTMRNWGYQTLRSEHDVRAAYTAATQAIARAAGDHGVCAAIYTQTSDVEGEVNGLLTYDRRVEKLPRAWLAQLHDRLRPKTE